MGVKDSKKNIVFISTNATTVKEHLELCNNLVNDFNIYIYSFYSLHNYKINKSVNIIELYNDNKVLSKRCKKSIIPNKIKRIIFNSSFYYILNMPKYIKNEKNKYLKSESIFKRINETVKPDIVVVPNDRSEIIVLFLLKKFKEKKVKTVIVPTSFLSGPERLILTREKNVEYTIKLHLFFKRKYKSMYYLKNKSYICFYPFHQVLLFRKYILSKNPWAIGSGNVTEIFVDGEHAKETLISLGTKPNKIVVTGHHSHDNLYFNLNRKIKGSFFLVKEFRESKNKKILVIALPHFGEHGQTDWDNHLKIINLICDALCKLKDIYVIVSLHPKMKQSDYSFVRSKYNLHITNKSLNEILFVADLFLSTYSSTIYWALLCKIKCGILNFHILNYKDMNWLGDIYVFNSLVDFKSNIFDFIRNTNFEIDNKKLSKIAPFDGNSKMRITNRLLSI